MVNVSLQQCEQSRVLTDHENFEICAKLKVSVSCG